MPESIQSMNSPLIKTRLYDAVIVTALFAAAVSATAQSAFRDFADAVDATLDGAREKREQESAPADIRAIFAKAKEAEEDGNINFCGFYVGMARADADALVSHYGLKDEKSSFDGDPVNQIWFDLKAVRRITKGGNSYDELCQAVANRTGDLKRKYESGESWYEYRTIDGVGLTMSEKHLSLDHDVINSGLFLSDRTGDVLDAAMRKVVEERKTKLQNNPPPEVKAVIEKIFADMLPIPGEDYRMGKTEVTQAQWEAVMGRTPASFKGADNPVENVSWYDCQRFLEVLNLFPTVKESGFVFRLPKKEEWKYACRAGATGEYCKLADGTEITEDTLGRVAWFDDNAGRTTHPVGQKEPNAFGLYDMFGNVREWCQEEDESMTNFVKAKGQDNEHWRFCCGGRYYSSSTTYFYSDSKPEDNRFYDTGFRLCAEKR